MSQFECGKEKGRLSTRRPLEVPGRGNSPGEARNLHAPPGLSFTILNVATESPASGAVLTGLPEERSIEICPTVTAPQPGICGLVPRAQSAAVQVPLHPSYRFTKLPSPIFSSSFAHHVCWRF